MFKKMLPLIAVFLLLAFPAWANQKPEEIRGVISSSTPYGAGTLTWTFFDVYDSSLWTDASKWSYEHSFALSITYKMNFTVKELVDKSVEEMERIHGIKGKDARMADKELTRLFKKVSPGDRITALYVPNQKIDFFYNGKKTGSLTQQNLLVPFMDIWLSPETERPELRAKLLNKEGENL